MPRASYTDDQVLTVARGGTVAGVEKRAASRWRREADEWATEQAQAGKQKRDAVPATRVARLLAAESASAETDGTEALVKTDDEGTFLARARTREALSREDLRGHLSGRLLQVIDYDMERLDELTPGQRRELAKFLAVQLEELEPKAAEESQGSVQQNPLVAIFNHMQQAA